MKIIRFLALLSWFSGWLWLPAGQALAEDAVCSGASAPVVACMKHGKSAASEGRSLAFRRDDAAGDASPMGPYGLLSGGLMAAAAWLWWRQKRAGRLASATEGSRTLQVLEKHRLSNKTTLYVVSHRGQEIMLAEHEHGVSVVRSLHQE